MDDDINALYCLAFGLCQNILAKVVLLTVEGAWGELDCALEYFGWSIDYI